MYYKHKDLNKYIDSNSLLSLSERVTTTVRCLLPTFNNLRYSIVAIGCRRASSSPIIARCASSTVVNPSGETLQDKAS